MPAQILDGITPCQIGLSRVADYPDRWHANKVFFILMEDSVLPPPTRQVGRALDWWLIDVPLGSVHIRSRFSGIGQMGFGILAPAWNQSIFHLVA